MRCFVMHAPYSRKRTTRHGTTAIEAAFVLPVFFFFVLALIEFGHAQMVSSVLQSACRAGARLGTTEGTTANDVQAQVQTVLGSAIDVSQATLLVKDAGVFDTNGPYPQTAVDFQAMPDANLSTIEPRQLFMVSASVAYNDIAIVPMPFMEGVVLDAQAFMRHE